MADFQIQFLESIIPGSDADLDVGSPPLIGLNNFDKTFLVPASYPHTTAGNGRASGGAQDDTLANVCTEAQLLDIDTVRFTDSTASSSFNNLVGCHVVEYRGPNGGPNEVIVRAVKVFSSTAQSFDSSAISGISDINKCVPFTFLRSGINNQTVGEHFAAVEIVNDGTNNVVRVTKQAAAGNTLFVTCYVVEFVGSNWTVQKVDHTFAGAGANEDVAISSVGNVADAFIYTIPKLTNSRPDRSTFYAWLSSTTNLRHWLAATTGTNPRVISWVISNPQLNVAVYGANPDGTSDLAATGSAPETRDITVTAVPDFQNQTMVLGYAGSLHNTAINVPSIVTMMNMTSSTNLRLRRSISNGGTEYKIQVIDFSGLLSGTINSVTPVVDTQQFTISGVFSNVTAVKINGVTQTIESSDATSVVCTCVLGTNRYGVPYDLVVTDSGVPLTFSDLEIGVPAGKDFVNLAPPLADSARRLATLPDLSGFEQIEWSLVIGGAVGDVIVYTDAAFSTSPAVTQFSFRAHDGTEWGSLGVQLVSAPIPPKTKALSCPIPDQA